MRASIIPLGPERRGIILAMQPMTQSLPIKGSVKLINCVDYTTPQIVQARLHSNHKLKQSGNIQRRHTDNSKSYTSGTSLRQLKVETHIPSP